MTYRHAKNQRTGHVTTCIDSTKFAQSCDKSSPDYEPIYCTYNKLAGELYQQDEVWISYDLPPQSNGNACHVSWFHSLL